VQTLSTAIVQAVQTLATEVVQVQAEARRQVAAERATQDRTVRQRLAVAYPDRWPDTPLAHALTVDEGEDGLSCWIIVASRRGV